MSSIHRALRVATVAIAVIAFAATPAEALAAARAATGTFPIEEHFVDPGASDACGFPVTADLSGVGRFEVRFDADGNATNVAIHFIRNGTLSGNGVSLSEIDRQSLFIDLQSGEEMNVGIAFRVTPAGGSPVVFDRGRLLVDPDGNFVFVAGPHPALDGDFEALCAALGGLK